MDDKFILENEALIYLVLKNLKIMYLKDLYYDVGMIGLVKACRTYDKEKGFTFSTYAYNVIKNEILCELKKENTEIRKSNKNTISLNTLLSFDGNEAITLEDKIPDDFNLEEYVETKEENEKLYTMIKTLTKKEQETICLYYGIGYKRLNGREIAEKLGVSRELIYKRKERALFKLRYRLTHYEESLLRFNSRNNNDHHRM